MTPRSLLVPVLAVVAGLLVSLLAYREGISVGIERANQRCVAAQEQARNQRDEVDTAASEAVESVRSSSVKTVESIRTVYRDRDNPVCITPDRVRALKELTDSDNSAAADSGPDTVRPPAASD